jgi:hypothetical protein
MLILTLLMQLPFTFRNITMIRSHLDQKGSYAKRKDHSPFSPIGVEALKPRQRTSAPMARQVGLHHRVPAQICQYGNQQMLMMPSPLRQ